LVTPGIKDPQLSSFIVTVDQGSSSTKVLAIDRQGRQAYRASRPLRIDRPRPGHVEQDPLHVLRETRAALDEVIASVLADGHEIAAIGLACQRSSFIAWDRREGQPYTPIISWQDLRARDLCGEFYSFKQEIYLKTGLPLTGHYGGPKFQWLKRHEPGFRGWIDLPGTVYTPWNCFLLYHLTEEKICATDDSIAGRTLFFDIHRREWDRELMGLFNVPEQVLPEVRPTCHLYGQYRSGKRPIPITCSIGDHQGALIGLGGLEGGQCALNYGTSAGVLSNLGSRPHIVSGLLTNIAYSTEEQANYTAEGTVNAAGSLFEWFEKEQGIPGASKRWEELMEPSSRGWYMLPGMYGIAAPYWNESCPTEFRGGGNGLSDRIMLRAGMESIAYLVADILDRLRTVPGLEINQITAAGGAARPSLLQFQADILGLPVVHSSIADATALGCAFMAGRQVGFWRNAEEIRDLIQGDRTFLPRLSSSQRQKLLEGWHELLRSFGILP
jgi:glycerol kinase